MMSAEFNFRIIDIPDGNQVIDWNHKTPCNTLTPRQMAEYMEVEIQFEILDRMEPEERLKCMRLLKM